MNNITILCICMMVLTIWCYIASVAILVMMHKLKLLKDCIYKMISFIDAKDELIDDMFDLVQTLIDEIDEDSSESKQDNSIDET